MKKKMLVGLGIMVFLIVGLRLIQFEIKDEIEIAAGPQKVWRAIVDFEQYHLWNTQLAWLGGEARLGSRLHLRLSAEGTAPYEFKPTVSHWDANKKFAWLARTAGMPRLFDGEHFFEIADLGNGKILLTNREEYRGVLSLIFKQLPMMKTAPQGFVRMNQELKHYIESL